MINSKFSNSYIYQIYLFLLLFTETDGFGLRGDGMWGGLGNASLGPFGFLQLFLMFTSLYLMFVYGGQLFTQKTKASKAVKAFMLLFLLILLELLVQSFFNIEKLEKITNLIRLKNWILLFTVPVLYQNIGIRGLINVIKVSGLIASAVVLFIITRGVEGTAIVMKYGTGVTHALRVMVPTASLITLTFFLFLSSYRHSKKWVDIVGILICFLGTFIQLHRSSTASLVLAIALFLLLEFKFSFGRSMIVVLGGIVLLAVLFKAIGYSFDMLFDVFTTSRENIAAGEDAGTSMRLGLIANGLSYVISNYVIFGIGLDWEPIEDTEMYNYVQFAATPVGDNGYFNVIIMFGVLGLTIFLIMLFRLFMSILMSKKHQTSNVDYKVICTGLFYYFFYNIMVAMGGDRFISDTIFPFLIGFILISEKLRLSKTSQIQKV